MTDQNKIRRVLRLIGILSDKPYRTAKELARTLEVTPKTIYDYLKLLEEIGYFVDKDRKNAFFIFEARKTDPSSLISEELDLLNQLINTVQPENPLRESMRRKLYLASTLVPLAEDLIDRHSAKIVQQLAEAIDKKKQVRLLCYQSATGEMARDRHVEPLSFLKQHSQVSAFDLEQKEIRHFKVKRIEDVVILDTARSFDSETYPTDVFGFTSDKPMLVKLQLSKRTYRLLIEEFPEAKAFASSSDISSRPYRFVYEARSPIGVGRFILGLPGEIVIESPLELQEYLKKRVTEYPLTHTVKTVA